MPNVEWRYKQSQIISLTFLDQILKKTTDTRTSSQLLGAFVWAVYEPKTSYFEFQILEWTDLYGDCIMYDVDYFIIKYL